jgi:hypothetical protein
MEHNEMLMKIEKQQKRKVIAEAVGIAAGSISGLAAEAVMTEVIFDQFKGDFKDFSTIKKAGMCVGTFAISATVAGLVYDYISKSTEETITSVQEMIFKDDVVKEVMADMEKESEKEDGDGRLPEEESDD